MAFVGSGGAAALRRGPGREQRLRRGPPSEGEPLPPVRVFVQGVSSGFGPASTRIIRHAGDRFRVFSGGKLEWRKGQDIVVEAFKRFSNMHPRANAQ